MPNPPTFRSLNQIIEVAIRLISFHPYVLNPLVVNGAGNPVRINKMRNFGGFDINNSGITLSVYPYTYEGTSNETVSSTNAGMYFKPFSVGSGSNPGIDEMTINLVVELQTTGVEHLKTTELVGSNQVVYERSTRESLLRDYAFMLRDILLTHPVDKVGGLVQNSTVNWTSFKSSKWVEETGKNGQKYVFHRVAFLWQLTGFAQRNGLLLAPQSLPTGPDGALQRTWRYVGIRTIDCEPIWWDTVNNTLVTGTGWRVATTPKGQPVVWDEADARLEKPDGTALAGAELQDPGTTPPNALWIRHDLLVAGYLLSPGGRELLLYDVTQARLEKCDGSVVTHINGVPVHYDPGTGQVIDTGTGQPLNDPTNFIGVNRSVVNVYEANGVVLREQFDI